MNNCDHKNTYVWEPHLAGARKCHDCGWVYTPSIIYDNPPMEVWFDEDQEKEISEREKHEKRFMENR